MEEFRKGLEMGSLHGKKVMLPMHGQPVQAHALPQQPQAHPYYEVGDHSFNDSEIIYSNTTFEQERASHLKNRHKVVEPILEENFFTFIKQQPL